MARRLALAALLLAACSPDGTPPNKTDGAPPTKTDGANEPVVSNPAVSPDGVSLGQLVAVDGLELAKLIAKTPAEVEAVLGAPKDGGSDRISCVRFVPERVFFACEQELHVYEHPRFEQIKVEFEDGKSSHISISGLPGEGSFDPQAALELVGIRVPDSPKHDNPPLGMGGEANSVVDRWEWGNSSARLRVAGLEFRVRVSVIDGEWQRAKVELINNSPLSEDQKARIKPVRGQ